MTVYKKKGGRIYFYNFMVSRRRFQGSAGTTNKAAAKKMERALKHQKKMEAKKVRSCIGQPMTILQACDRYWNEVGQYTVAPQQAKSAQNWLVSYFGDECPIRTIGNSQIAKMVSIRRAESSRWMARGAVKRVADKVANGTSLVAYQPKMISSSTVNRSVTAPLKRILSRARDLWGEPIAPIIWKKHRLKEPQERIRCLSEDEEARLFRTLLPAYHPIVTFAVLTGCRAMECVNLSWKHVDLDAASAIIHGKGGKIATVPLSKGLVEMMRRCRGEALPDHQVFRKLDGSRMTYPAFYAAFKTACARAQVADMRIHDLRHTAATRILSLTGNLEIARILLRHANINTTSRYAHVNIADVRNALDALEASRNTRPQDP